MLGAYEDGSVIVGTMVDRLGVIPLGGTEAFIWNDNDGILAVRQELIDADSTLAPLLAGWRLTAATDITPDGRIIVGIGVNPNGQPEPWIARLDGPATELPDIIADTLAWDLDTGGLNIEYSIQGDVATESRGTVFWASESHPGQSLGFPIFVFSLDNEPGSHRQLVPFLALISVPPAGATHFVVTLDNPVNPTPGGGVAEANEDNNWKSLRLSVTFEQLRAIMPRLPSESAARFLSPLNGALDEQGIDTPRKVAAFLAQVAVESNSLQKWEEAWDTKFRRLRLDRPAYAATSKEDYFNYWYSGVNGNGDYNSGDGFTFRGLGPIQLTGRDNYKNVGEALGIDLVANPDLVADTVLRPIVGFRVAAYFFATKKLALNSNAGRALIERSSLSEEQLSGTLLDIAELVNIHDAFSVFDVNDAITYGVNGGFTARIERLGYYRQALRVLVGT